VIGINVYILLILFIVIVIPAMGFGIWLVISTLLGIVLGVLLGHFINLGKIIFSVRKILIICVALACTWEILMIFNSQPAIFYFQGYWGYWVGAHIAVIIAIAITVIRAIQKKPENFDSFKARMQVGMLVTSVLYLAFVSVLL